MLSKLLSGSGTTHQVEDGLANCAKPWRRFYVPGGSSRGTEDRTNLNGRNGSSQPRNTRPMKIHDWTRAYWINSSGEREYDPSSIEPEENVLCIYENDHGDRVAYALTDRSEQVEVTLDMSDFDADEAERDRSEEVEARLNETLREIEDEAEERFRSTSVVDRDEDGDEVAVTVEITWDVGKYEVRFNGELITDVEFEEGSRWFKEGDGGRQEQFQEARLRTRADAREFAAAWRDDFGAPEQLG